MENEEKIKLIKKYIIENYNSDALKYTSERSYGNYDDCFYDGDAYGTAWVLKSIAEILEINLS